MNNLLQVKLPFNREANNQRGGTRNLRSKAKTSDTKIDSIINDLQRVLSYYKSNPTIVSNMPIAVIYNDIIAKSNRIRALLKPIDGKNINDTIIGSQFTKAPEGEENHIIVYYADEKTITDSIIKLKIIKSFIRERLSGIATSNNFNEPDHIINYDGFQLGKTEIRDLIVDCSVVDRINSPRIDSLVDKETYLVTFYNTELKVADIMEKIGAANQVYSSYGDNTISVSKPVFEYINNHVPYLISMISSDISQLDINVAMHQEEGNYDIPEPINEPTIGVIDTLFDTNVYFSSWVDNHDNLDEFDKKPKDQADRLHGTQVSSIIVDGPTLNPWLDDGCGRFRVRHFGVCVDKISPSKLMEKITKIVNENPDIHVWNLSLGTEDEVSSNFISYDGAVLDYLQSIKDVIFVVSGTNDKREVKKGTIKIGSPADSLNSIVVNAVNRDGRVASYTREGKVLSFFNKPDVSYYGGDYDDPINAYSGNAVVKVCGTSFAAPWISRKVCFLIDIMGLSREVAKALIIDAAAGWDYKKAGYKKHTTMGYGIVPIDINSIMTTESDEVKFVLFGSANTYRTSNYSIPVPRDDESKYPFVARATLCYFPECSRSQGVDYTNRELSFKLGRVTNKGTIDDINDNNQDDGGYVTERQSRKEFRKWENTKFISKQLGKNRSLKSYEERQWGIAITSKERLDDKMNSGINFGIVVTLKEINGINRHEEFVRACRLRGWIVNEMNIDNQIDIYNESQQEVYFE